MSTLHGPIGMATTEERIEFVNDVFRHAIRLYKDIEMEEEFLDMDDGDDFSEVDKAVGKYKEHVAWTAEEIGNKQSGWKPIETAPRDGTEVDLWHRSGYRVIGIRWNSAADHWQTCHNDMEFTHWMPTPDWPETTGTPDNKRDQPKMVSAGLVAIIDSDGEKVQIDNGLVIKFDNAESLRAALVSGKVSLYFNSREA